MRRLAWYLSFCTGFISLSEEILWVRIVGFASEGTPRAFAMVLTAFLGGIALGALAGKGLSERNKATPITAAWLMLVAGGLLLALPSIITVISHQPFTTGLMLVLIFLGAALKGTLFPIVHHLGSVQGDALGCSVSQTYFCNILGATLGPLVIGLFLLDHFSSGSSLQLLGALCFISALPPLLFGLKTGEKWAKIIGLVICFFGLLLYPVLRPAGLSLMPRLANAGDSEIRIFIENRHGVVHSVATPGEDTVYGGNVYDGKTNTNLVRNTNMIDRAYLLYGLHPAPKRVLVIGLSSGAWTRIITAMPTVERIDVVEINPGYVEMIRSYPHLAPLLDDRRLNLHIDDGRRWLRRSHQQFDMIVMNTTFHWRANITNLLSVEMLQLISDSLAPDGVFAFNTTSSYDAFKTASKVFPHAYMFRNFVYAGKYDFREQLPKLPERLKQFRQEGKLMFPDNPEYQGALSKLALIKFIRIDQIAEVFPRQLETVTDQNMITEFRYGRWSGSSGD